MITEKSYLEAKKLIADYESEQLNKPVVSTSTLDGEKTPYCTDCGNDKLAYLDQYANGEYWKCKE